MSPRSLKQQGEELGRATQYVVHQHDIDMEYYKETLKRAENGDKLAIQIVEGIRADVDKRLLEKSSHPEKE